jgi:outer membrane immunogenic protein
LSIHKSPPDPAYQPTALSYPPSWSGAYFGIGAGLAWARSSGVIDTSAGTTAYDDAGKARPQGRALVGYDWLLGSRTLLGVVGDVGWAGVHAPINPTSVGGNDATVAQGRVTEGLDGSLLLRGGFLVRPDVLVYTTGGATLGAFRESSVGCCGEASSAGARVGWTLGGGAEAAVARDWRVQAEYRLGETPLPGVPGAILKNTVTDQRLTLGVVFRPSWL